MATPDSPHLSAVMSKLGPAGAQARMAVLHPDWQLDLEARQINRSFAFQGFAKPVQLANLLVWYAERAGHHPDIAFGWGYCRITYKTHDSGGLTELDFATAEGFDRLVA